MTRTGGVSTGATRERRAERRVRSDSGDARQENRKGDATRGLGAATVANQRRSGMVRRPAAPDGTARPVNVEGMRAKPQERRPDRSVRRREGDGRPIDRAGDQGAPGRRATALESGAARRGMAPGERRDRRRTARLDAPQGAEDAPTPSPPDRTARPNPRDHGQADTPGRSGRQYSPHVAQDTWRPGPKACEPDGPPVIAVIL